MVRGDLGGQIVQVVLIHAEIEDAERDPVLAGQHVGPGLARHEGADHRGGQLARIGRHRLTRNSVITGEDHRADPIEGSRGGQIALAGRQPGGRVLEPAEGAERFGQRLQTLVRGERAPRPRAAESTSGASVASSSPRGERGSRHVVTRSRCGSDAVGGAVTAHQSVHQLGEADPEYGPQGELRDEARHPERIEHGRRELVRDLVDSWAARRLPPGRPGDSRRSRRAWRTSYPSGRRAGDRGARPSRRRPPRWPPWCRRAPSAGRCSRADPTAGGLGG